MSNRRVGRSRWEVESENVYVTNPKETAEVETYVRTAPRARIFMASRSASVESLGEGRVSARTI